MDQKALVTRDKHNGQRLTRALVSDSKIGLRASFWWFDPETERWSLVVATRLYRTDGPRAAYKAIEKHIRKLEPKRASGTFLDLGDIVAVSDSDARVQAMSSAVSVSDSDVRVQSSMLNGVYVTDALVYELRAAGAPAPRQVAEPDPATTTA